jgi:hypothetical protein
MPDAALDGMSDATRGINDGCGAEAIAWIMDHGSWSMDALCWSSLAVLAPTINDSAITKISTRIAKKKGGAIVKPNIPRGCHAYLAWPVEFHSAPPRLAPICPIIGRTDEQTGRGWAVRVGRRNSSPVRIGRREPTRARHIERQGCWRIQGSKVRWCDCVDRVVAIGPRCRPTCALRAHYSRPRRS